jgi:predicted TIM-barrel enzyme
VLVLCHGGPIATPEDARFILQHCPGCDGFYGASSMERLPAEVALTETTQAFTRIRREAAPAKAGARKSSKRRAP